MLSGRSPALPGPAIRCIRYEGYLPDSLLKVTDGTGANYVALGFRNLTGSTGSHSYDLNGSLTADPFKGLAIAYNVFSRTDKITVTTATNRWIDYTYDGSVTVIRKRTYDNNVLQTTTDYVGGMVYVNGSLAYFPMQEGRVVNNTGTLVAEYIISDQQGNARISFNNTGTGGAAKVVKRTAIPDSGSF